MNATVKDYLAKRDNLFGRWENECREWIALENKLPVIATFFRDGIIDPDIWFSHDFRPLFILKEVHDTAIENRCVDFVSMQTGHDYDIWERRGMWRAFGTLARGILSRVENPNSTPGYEELYNEDLSNYHATLRRVAIINVKKLSSGSRVTSDRSIETKHVTCHACRFRDNLREQIEMINPTVIICCGADLHDCFDMCDNQIYGIPAVFGLHPSTNPNRRRQAYFYDTIEKVIAVLHS